MVVGNKSRGQHVPVGNKWLTNSAVLKLAQKKVFMVDIVALNALLEPHVESMGLALVRVAMMGGKSDPTLQIMAERPDTRQLNLEDCAALSHILSDVLDAHDPIEEAYRLEVSSPGIDRPLTRLHDFTDWQGHEAKLTFLEPLNARKQVNGILCGLEEENVMLRDAKGEMWCVPHKTLKSAKLVLTNKLIAATAPLDADGAESIQKER
jgi:ribosome maturation factor RimP